MGEGGGGGGGGCIQLELTETLLMYSVYRSLNNHLTYPCFAFLTGFSQGQVKC